MGSTWVNALLSAISLGTAGVFVIAATRRPAGRPSCLAHALMGIGMAGMFSPWGDPVPTVVGALGFTVVAAGFGARLLRSGRQACIDSAHLVVGPLAMVFMYVAMGPTTEPMHVGHAMAMSGRSWWISATALGLMGYFVWYAWTLIGRLRGPAPAVSGNGAVAVSTPAVTLAGIVVGAHVMMCTLMAVMFLGAV
jgi:hypothetical protein